MGDPVHLGNGVHIDGEITGHEDLVIDGTVKGQIRVKGHQLTIGKGGEVTADIEDAGSVVVEGRLVGNVTAEKRVEVAASGSMHGNMRAPRVVLADGAQFKGSVDMDLPKAAAPPRARQSSAG